MPATLVTNLTRDGAWVGEKRELQYDTNRLRIVRRNDLVSTYRWSECGWAPLSGYEVAIPEPLYLTLGVGNDWDSTLSPVKARWTIEQISPDESPFGADWAPESCSVLTPGTLPDGVQVPADLTLAMAERALRRWTGCSSGRTARPTSSRTTT